MIPYFPGHLIRKEQVTSTNNYLLDLSVEKKLPEGTIVRVDNQTNGRGLGQNSWESEPGKNLTFSIILYPVNVPASNQFILSKFISLSVRDFLKRYIGNVYVKWPNDIYAGNKKITGILIENFIEGSFLTKSILGIGVNINQEVFLSGAPNPVSLYQLTGKKYDLDVCMNELRNHMAQRYQILKSGEFDKLDKDYLKYMYQVGKPGKFSSNGKIFSATITGVNQYGMLQMITDQNEEKTFGFKEVKFEIDG